MDKIKNSAVIYYKSPIGCLRLTAGEKGLRKVEFCDSAGVDAEEKPEILENAVEQLDQYFAGKRYKFDIKKDVKGTVFQQAVWDGLDGLPYGASRTYKDLAALAGNAKAARAAGMACNKNPLPVIVPCHRVVGSNGKLTGYAGGIDKKRWLLEFESSI